MMNGKFMFQIWKAGANHNKYNFWMTSMRMLRFKKIWSIWVLKCWSYTRQVESVFLLSWIFIYLKLNLLFSAFFWKLLASCKLTSDLNILCIFIFSGVLFYIARLCHTLILCGWFLYLDVRPFSLSLGMIKITTYFIVAMITEYHFIFIILRMKR